MEVLWINNDNLIQERIIRAMERKKWKVIKTDVKACEAKNEELYSEIKKQVKKRSYSLCFSIDFSAEAARACDELGIKYAAWIYDLTSIEMYSKYAFATTTYLFIPDYSLYKKLAKRGYPSVYYLPWGTEIQPKSKEDVHDISFVGSLYRKERQELTEKIGDMEDYSKGYLTALMKMQAEVSGEYFLESLLDKRTVEALQKVYPFENRNKSYVSDAWYYANAIVAPHITGELRENNLKELEKQWKVIWYSKENDCSDHELQCNGTAETYSELTSLYEVSRINLNMTFRSMESGIPVQALDIMGSGGFLLSNYQDDFQNFFVPGEDYVCFTSTEELVALVQYYLENEEERCRIARQGYEKVRRYHTYDCRIESVLQIMFTKEELQLLQGIKELEEIRREDVEGHSYNFNDLKVIESAEQMRIKADKYFEGVETEREISFLLKRQLMEYIDSMMAKGDMVSWEKMIIWYKRIGSVLAVSFWEIFIWRTMLLIYSDEVALYKKEYVPVSVLRFRSMAEMEEVYFKTMFLLRRLEYGIEPMEEIVDYINEWGLSYIFVRHVLEKAQVENKEQIMKAIEGIWAKYGSR